MTRKRPAANEDLVEPLNENSESETEIASKHSQKKTKSFTVSRTLKENSSYEIAGAIESIEVENFMCHSKLRVSFNPKLNFVIGHNGSGKSAILTALLICLGGRARFTNRGENLKSFIKEGASYAVINVRIFNSGSDAYAHSTYGDFIHVQRRFTREGTSTYKIMNSSGKVVSNKRDELDSICDMLQIQVDNPLTVLTQDAARMFLSGNTPKEKYKFFAKGTQLAQLSEDYIEIADKVKTIESILIPKRDQLIEQKQDLKKLQEQWQAAEHAQELENRLKNVQDEMLWAQIQIQEEEILEKQQHVAKISRKAASYNERMLGFKEKLQEVGDSIKEIKDRNEISKQAIDPIKIRLIEAKNEKSNIQSEMARMEIDIRETCRSINELKDSQIILNTRIESASTKLESGDYSSQKQSAYSAITNKKNFLNEKQDERTRLSDKIFELNQKKAEIENAYRLAQADFKKVQERLSSCENMIRQLQRQSKERLLAFGPKTLDIKSAIEKLSNSGKWLGRPPLGPIGSFIKPRYKEYNEVLESVLNNVLNGYVVETQQDMKLLQSVFEKYNVHQNTPIFKFDSKSVFNFSDGEPEVRFLTIRRAIDVQDRVVLCLLVVQSKIEQSLLVKNRAEGDAISERGYPKNCCAIFTRDCFSMGHRQGGFATMNVTKYNGLPRLESDVQEHLKHENQKLEDLRLEKQKLSDSLTDLNNQKNIADSEMDQHKQALGRLDSFIDTLKIEISRISADSEQTIAQEELDLKKYKEIYIGNEEKLTQLRNQLDALRSKEGDFKKEIANIEQTQKKLVQEKGLIEGEIARFQENIGIMECSKLGYETNYTDDMRKHNELISQIKQEELLIQSDQVLLDKAISSCLEVCSRVQVSKSLSDLEKEALQLEALIKEQTAIHGDRQVLWKKLSEKKENYQAAKKELRGISEILEQLNEAQDQRNEMWSDLRKYISSRARMIFSELMTKRDYVGSLELDHDEKKLHLKVHTNKSDLKEGASGRDSKSLSGGEKSFSTICLLLALWESIGSPFRALDEFDVFMDPVNRKMSMRLIIGHAREQKKDCQYILITPQDTSAIKELGSSDIRIQRLSDPERGQSTISSSTF